MQSTIDFGAGDVPWLSIAALNTPDSAETIHFSPANGIPVASYAEFFSNFSDQYNISGMDSRGAWPSRPEPIESFQWQDHADDLIAAIEQQYTTPVIGMGHSIGGAVTLLAAVKCPELFSKIVIIDAASLPSQLISRFFHLIPQWLSFRLFPFIKKTHFRQATWASRQAFIDNYRNHPTYRLFTEESLQNYAQAGLIKQGQDYHLVFNPHWESLNFRRIYYLWKALAKINHPTLVLRAENTYMYTQAQFDSRNEHLPANIEGQTIKDANHLVTHEQPQRLAQQIMSWIH